MGSARASQEARERAEAGTLDQGIKRMERDLVRKRQALEAQISVLRDQFEAEEEELKKGLGEFGSKKKTVERERERMAVLRDAD
jgi:circadian clock protein KaiC